VEAHGPGLEPQGVAVNALTEFTVDARKAGQTAALDISAVDADSNPVEVKVTDNGNATYTCKYTPTKPVMYTICIAYGGVAIPKSPFKVFRVQVALLLLVSVFLGRVNSQFFFVWPNNSTLCID